MPHDRLDPASRERALQHVAASDVEFDVLVIGGGVTGAGIALDAATRGLETCIVEAGDWAVGTSSRSSKLVHGGLRYLKTLDFKLIREALAERDLLLTKLAPHLVRAQKFIFPLRRWERPIIGAGVALYDMLGAGHGEARLPGHRHIGRRQLRRIFPGLNPDAYSGGITYYDATVDDARLVLSLVRTAVGAGATALSRARAVRLLESPTGVVTGAVVQDLESGAELTVSAKHVIGATGVWTEATQKLAGTSGGLRVLASKGVHIVVPRQAIRGQAAIVTQTRTSVLFLIPWGDYWVIGTTDTSWGLDPSNPLATASDVEYLIEQANAVLDTPIRPDQIVSVFAGLRPLLQRGVKPGTSSSKVSREHTVASPVPGLTVIAGGKLTTYRVMARDAVDHALGESASEMPSVTHETPIIGATGLAEAIADTASWRKRFGWSDVVVDHLLGRFGDRVREIAGLCDDDPALAEPLVSAPTHLRAEIAHAVTHEGAIHLDDVLSRRTHLSLQLPDRGSSAVREVASIMAPLLGWDPSKTETEIAEYSALARAESNAMQFHDDRDAARMFDATFGESVRTEAPTSVTSPSQGAGW